MAVLSRILIVAFGGAVGSACRYGFALIFPQRISGMPLPTLIANFLGCLIIGFVSELAVTKSDFSPELRLLLVTGFCGGMTTLSSYLFEVNGLLRDRDMGMALFYGLVTLVLSFGALWGGIVLCRAVFSR